ncbi:hypothetical protein [Kushneria phosphatilytica]|uniref:Uncharacterized protein n=1 Tax=Kushneria phosphatilytica TaxID=657387 RepID=A0A5C1A450_9GAMM|nr:hypothetical protein [Kushneria phosphatilytica]QEL11859.1 hypothetical protein FY550_12405 [Kushneria phosphatilytica]
MQKMTNKECVQGVHLLIGSTLRDGRRDRTGRIVGIDQTRDHPVVDIVWQGQRRAERIIVTCDQLRDLVEACRRQELKARTDESPAESPVVEAPVAMTEQRRLA